MTSPQLSLVAPVFGNSGTLAELARRVRAFAREHGLAYELLFVDDASPDDSLSVLRSLAAADEALGGLSLRHNVGQNAALLSGFAAASGEWVVALDADLQDPPEAVPGLLTAGRLGYDAVFAGRRGRYQERSRMISSRLYKRTLHRLCGLPPDAGLCFAASRRMVRSLLERRGDGWILPLIGFSGLPVTSVPVQRSVRPLGTSAYSSWGRVRVAVPPLFYAVRRRCGLARPRRAPPIRLQIRERLGRCARSPGRDG